MIKDKVGQSLLLNRNTKFAQDQVKQQKELAIKAIERADSFIVITVKKNDEEKDNVQIAAITGVSRHTLSIVNAFQMWMEQAAKAVVDAMFMSQNNQDEEGGEYNG